MMDQFGNGYKDQYKNQYKKETSQIHAPAALLERTRQAVEEEEKRLQAENPRDEMQKVHHWNYGRVYRWAFSVAAAVILLFAVHRSAMLWRTGAGGMEGEAGSGVAATDLMGESGGTEYANAEAEGYAKLQSAPSKTENSASVPGEPAEGINGDRGSEAAESSSLSRDVSEDMASADMDDSMEGYDDASGLSSADQIEELDKKYSEEESVSQISVTEVNRKPDFCSRSDTKRIVNQGITFYVIESAAVDDIADTAKAEKGEWSAYAEYNGKKYIVTGQADNREEFLEEACGFLKEP